MASLDPLLVIIALIGFASFIMGGFFAVRGFYRFKAWQAGEKEELWTFLSLIVGCGSLILIGICAVPFGVDIGSISTETELVLIDLGFIGILLGIAATGLMTFYYIQKWQAAK
jgi:hypothetical protein